ncbi:MAG: bifunctional UDP-N-acetylglucosamine diphosphorylase/glucosamine-1-phosphate N-acetyltransferase GlmU [Cryobacterium sp.]|nr:bifunctional UDP-N-acetylglucosamine diphosphorylase/glucosamine-1-phosphate N-acetyltransferase GlmU [Cryobacterium sp.]
MVDQNLAIIILAAGEGTRMKSRLPKVLHNLAGVPMLGHVLATAKLLEPVATLTVVRHERDLVARTINEISPETIVIDQDEIPGTGRAVEIAIESLPEGFGGEVLVISADVPLLDFNTLAELVSAHRSAAGSATLLSAVLENATGYGRIIRSSDGLVDRIVEQKDASPAELEVTEINTGSYVFSISALRTELPKITTSNNQGEKYLTDVIGLLRKDSEKVVALEVSDVGVVSGVNDRVQLAEAAARMNAKIIRRHQLAGVTIVDPLSTWIDFDVVIAEDVEILPGTQLKGATKIERGAIIGPDTTLTDCEIGENAIVKRTDGTLAVIGKGATVGPFAYLRPNTILGDEGKIGTFVETKNSNIGFGSKVPHLSYIGDTEVGVKSNIGAGTITANYDGVEKHHTKVGSHVRSGSHNVFAAPVTIGDGAYTGAGTVVRKDVPPGALAISVAPQRNMEGWVEQKRPGTAAAKAAEQANAQHENPHNK